MLMTSGEITELTRVPCVFLPVILLAVSHHPLEPRLCFNHSLFTAFTLVHVNECVDSLLTNNFLCLVTPMRCFVSDFAEMLYQGGHVRRVPGRYSNPDEWKTLIKHRP